MPHAWKHSRPGWRGLWAACSRRLRSGSGGPMSASRDALPPNLTLLHLTAARATQSLRTKQTVRGKAALR